MGQTRQEQKHKTRAAILEAACRVFSEKGITAARMSDVAQAAGLSHGTVFVHFHTQDELICEVVNEYAGRIAQRTHQLAESCGSMRDLLRAHLAGIGEYEPFYTRLVIERRQLPPEAAAGWVAIQSAVSHHFHKTLEREAGPAGQADTPVHLLFNQWVALVHYYLANGDLFAPEGNVIARYGETLVNAYLQMLPQVAERGSHG